MRCLLAKLNDYLREHSVSVGYIDADPPPHFGPLGNGREKHRLAVPRAPTKIVALLGSPGALSSPSRMSVMSVSRPASSGGTHPKVGVNGLCASFTIACSISRSFTLFHKFSLCFTIFHLGTISYGE